MRTALQSQTNPYVETKLGRKENSVTVGTKTPALLKHAVFQQVQTLITPIHVSASWKMECSVTQVKVCKLKVQILLEFPTATG